jgi:FtsH-binding integral membrane protein
MADGPNDLVDRAYQAGAHSGDALAPAAWPDRRGVIRALGIVQIVFGGLSGLVFLFAIGTIVLARQPSLIAPGTVYILPAVNLLVTGIGSVRIARWAHLATLISSAVWLGLMLLGVLGIAFLIRKGAFAMGGGEAVMLGFIVVPIALVVLGLPIVLLIVYTRPSVRATFERYRR